MAERVQEYEPIAHLRVEEEPDLNVFEGGEGMRLEVREILEWVAGLRRSEEGSVVTDIYVSVADQLRAQAAQVEFRDRIISRARGLLGEVE